MRMLLLLSIVVAMIAGGTIVAYASVAQYSSLMSNSCVKAGEPLYPSTEVIPLSTFTQTWGNKYQLAVNQTAQIITVHSSTHIGSTNLTTMTFPLIQC